MHMSVKETGRSQQFSSLYFHVILYFISLTTLFALQRTAEFIADVFCTLNWGHAITLYSELEF
jgi:hypothetical protein